MPSEYRKNGERGLGFEFSRPGSFSQGRKRNLLIFIVLNIVTLTHAFEATCLCVTLPTIAKELNASVSDSFSLSTLFLLCMTLAQPLFSEISWITGRQPAFVLAHVLFVAGTIMCGCAKTPMVLLAGRAIQGAGAGATEPVKALVLFDLYDLRERSKWISYMNVSWALGTVIGPVIGGLFTETPSLTWRWIFWINLPFLGLSLAGSLWLLGYDSPTKMSWGILRRIDWGGLALFITSSGLILLSLSWAGSSYSWSSSQVIATLVIGVCMLPVLGWYETVAAAKPIFRPSVFRHYSTVIHLLNVLLHGLLMWMLLYYMSLFYMGIKGFGPLETGLWALPAILTVAPMAMVVGFVVARTGHYRTFLILGWYMTAVSFLFLHYLEVDIGKAPLIVVSIIAGVSFGALVPGMSVGVLATVNREDAGHAICMTMLMRPAGQALGIAMGLTVFSTMLERQLVDLGYAEGDAQHLLKFLASHSAKPSYGDPALEATVGSLRGVWTVGMAIAGLALVLTVVTKCPRLPPDDNNDEVQMGDEAQVELVPIESQQRNGNPQSEHGYYNERSSSKESRLGNRPVPSRGFATADGAPFISPMNLVSIRLTRNERI